MYKKFGETKDAVNEHRVYLIEKVLIKMKKAIKNVSEHKAFKIEENEDSRYC